MRDKKEAPTGGTVAGRTLSTTESYHTPGPLSSEAAEIIRLHHKATEHAKAAIETAFEIGERLAGVKRSLPHGQWMGWVNDNLPFGVNEAANYMRVWRRKDELNSQRVVSLKAAVLLLAEPKPPRITIDPEFSTMLPPLRDVEYRQLEKNLLADGCLNPLVVWRGILLDGHARYEICKQHGISFETREIDLPDREAAKDWIDRNQLGRANLLADEVNELYTKLVVNMGGPDNVEKGLDAIISILDIDTHTPPPVIPDQWDFETADKNFNEKVAALKDTIRNGGAI